LPISGGSGAVALRCGADWIRREEVEAIGSRDDDGDDAKIPAALGLRARIGFAGGLRIWARRWALGFFCFFPQLYHGGHSKVPVAANRFTAAGTGARRGGFTIYRDLLTATDAFARRGKPKLPAAVKHSVVVLNINYYYNMNQSIV